MAFGRCDGPDPGGLLTGLATLTLLSELASERPLLCVVDDIQWSDRPSIGVLKFLTRRLESEPVVLLLASRADEDSFSDSATIDMVLPGLEKETARQLLLERAELKLSPAQQDAILNAAQGNPLAICTLEPDAVQVGPDYIPLSLVEELRRTFYARVQKYGRPVQLVLLLVAAAGHLRYEVLAGAAYEFGPTVAKAVDALFDLNDLITMSDGVIGFHHPLIRSAVYHTAESADRRDAHTALAAAFQLFTDAGDAHRCAWHLGQAADGPDEAIADRLEQAAAAASGVSLSTAAVLLAHSARLSTDGRQRSRRRSESAIASWHAGEPGRAAAIVRLLEQEVPLDTSLRYSIGGIQAMLELFTGALSML